MRWPRTNVAGLLFLALLLPAYASAGDDKGTKDEEKETEWTERVVVTAEVEGVATAPRGASTTVLDPARSADPPQALTDLVALAPAVSENGQGGLFQNVSIRGVSRNRVRHMISGVRITDERRAGPATSFIDPLLMGSVEIMRGPATTFHGSGALGGTIQVLPRRLEQWTVQTGWVSAGDERYLMAGGAGEHWSVGLVRREQENAEAADGTQLNSHFEQTSAVLRFDWGNAERRSYRLIITPSRGTDIGKSNSDFPLRATNYPDERHDLMEFEIADRDGWRLRAYMHDRDLETIVDEPLERGQVLNDSTDFGAAWERSTKAGSAASVAWGFDLFSRTSVDSVETITVLDPMNPSVTVSQPLDGGRETEWGGFAVVHWSAGGAQWDGGLRISRQYQGNQGDPNLSRSALNGFVGVIKPLGKRFKFNAAASSGERFPSLGELYFTGLTGRGDVFGNPLLVPERALNVEVGSTFSARRVIVRGALFRNKIEDYIERIEFAPGMLTFDNLISGTIEGLELSGVSPLGSNWFLAFGGHLLKGRASDGSALADVPAHEFWSEARWRHGKFQADARLTHRATKADPGSGERAIPAADLLSLAARYQASESWSFYAGMRNGLDELYWRSADDKATPSTGRTFSAGIVWRNGVD